MEKNSFNPLPWKPIKEAAQESVKYIDDRRKGNIVTLESPWVKYNNISMQGFEWHTIHTFAGMSGSGKCLGKGTYVLMFDNTIKKVENVVVGDQLMGPDSKPRNVLSIARGREQMYWIRQNKGIDYRVNESHILSLKARVGKKKDSILNIPVKDCVGKNKSFFREYKGYKTGKLEFDNSEELLIDPYFLGLWLGDGHKSNPAITTMDPEIVEEVYNQSIKYNLTVRIETAGDKCPVYHLSGERGYVESNPLTLQMRHYNLLFNKHIPECYMKASFYKRLQLLAGLLDSDGHCSKKAFEITQKNAVLAEQIVRLARSCGFYVSITDKRAVITSIGYESMVKRMHINGECHLIPTRVARKQCLEVSTRNTNWLVTGITLEKDTVDDYYGFEIDGDRLFLLEDQTVTHNTAMLNQLESSLVDLNPNEKMNILSFNFEMLARNLVSRKFSKATNMTVQELHSGREEVYITDRMYDRIVEEGKVLADYPIYYVDIPGTVEQIFKTIMQFHAEKCQNGEGLVITLDHSILVRGKKNELERVICVELMTMFNYLKKQIKCIVIILSQLNREVESVERVMEPSQHYPKKRDIFGSDSLFMFSDVVTVMMNPEQIGIQSYGPRSLPVRGFLYWHILKVREGEPAVLQMLNQLKYNRIVDYCNPSSMYNLNE